MEILLEYLIEWIEVFFMLSISLYIGYDIYKRHTCKEPVRKAYIVCFVLSLLLSIAAAVTLIAVS